MTSKEYSVECVSGETNSLNFLTFCASICSSFGAEVRYNSYVNKHLNENLFVESNAIPYSVVFSYSTVY